MQMNPDLDGEDLGSNILVYETFHKASVSDWSFGTTQTVRQLGGTRRRWEDTIKIYIQEMGWGGIDSIVLAQDRDKRRALVNAVMNIRVP
jgi:hypothetical protein